MLRTDEIHEAIRELREELERLDHVIKQIEAIAEDRAVIGRPPSFMKRKRRPGSDSETSDPGEAES